MEIQNLEPSILSSSAQTNYFEKGEEYGKILKLPYSLVLLKLSNWENFKWGENAFQDFLPYSIVLLKPRQRFIKSSDSIFG